MDLDADAVELPLDRRRSPMRSSAASTDSAVCASIGCSGRPTTSRNCGQALGAGRERGGGHRAELAAEHDRAPHVPRAAGRPRAATASVTSDGQRALPQLAGDQPAEQALLRARWPGRTARSTSSRRRVCEPGPDSSAMVGERRVDLGDRQRRLGGRRRQVAQRRPADPGPALQQLAGQVRDGRDHLVRRRGAQAVGEQRDLDRAGRRGGDLRRRRGDLGEEHRCDCADPVGQSASPA